MASPIMPRTEKPPIFTFVVGGVAVAVVGWLIGPPVGAPSAVFGAVLVVFGAIEWLWARHEKT